MKAGYVSSRYLLAVLTSPEDAAQLREILQPTTGIWLSHGHCTRLWRHCVQMSRLVWSFAMPIWLTVVAGSNLLTEIQALEVPPQLIVADRFANDRLWVEVLESGRLRLARDSIRRDRSSSCGRNGMGVAIS